MVSPLARVPMWPAFAIAALLLCSLTGSLRAEDTAADESAAAPEGPSFVLTLDSSNVSDTIAKHPFIVVEFYAPWCGHCKNLAPEYEKAAAELSKLDPPIVLAKLDASDEANKEIASKYEVKGFPTIQIFRNEGKNMQEYKGPRQAEGIVEYLKKQAGPASVELKSSEDASKHFNEKKIYIVGVFSKLSGEEFEKYITVAEKLRSDYDFGHTSHAKFLPRGESTVKPPFVRLFKPFDELYVDSEDFSVDALEKFIEGSSVPLVTLLNEEPDNQPFLNKFFENGNDKAMFFLDFNSENFEAFKSAYYDIAGSSKGEKISFLMGDLNATDRAFEFFGLKKDQAPLVIVQTSNGRKKFLKTNVEPTHIAAWIKDYLGGNVQPYRRSQPIPEVNNEPVKEVVGENFNDVVFGSGKNVLIEFYAPWCGHCKKLAPILDEIATSLQSDSNVVIAKLDATANDVPSDDIEILGFPTLYLRTPSGKLVKYEGEERTKEDILAFIQETRDPAVETKSVKDEL